MAEYDAWSPPARAARLEPRSQRLGLSLPRRSLGTKRQAAIRIHIAQARQAVGDEAQALLAFEALVPEIRLIAVHAIEEPFGIAP